MLAYLIIGYVAVALAIFSRFHRPLAVVMVLLVGVLFLPEIQSSPAMKNVVRPLTLPLLEFSKVNVIAYGLLLGWLIHDFGRGPRIRWGIADLPCAALALFPPAAILLNDGGLNEAFAEFRNLVMVWAVPYFVGRRYLGESEGCRLAITGLALGGLAYMPLCLAEVRLSPQLHNQVYGFHQHDFVQSLRFGGFRPMVFMQHGLAVAFFMTAAGMSLFWLSRSHAWRPGKWTALRANVPLLLVAMAGTTVLCRSLGALILGSIGLLTLLISHKLNTRTLMIGLMMIAPAYAAARVTGLWKGDDLVSLIGKNVQAERSQSLEFRLRAEEVLMKIVARQPITGMGVIKDPLPTDQHGRPVIPDGLWIIWYYNAGLIGLVALLGFFLTPVFLVLRKVAPREWRHPEVASVAVGAVIVTLLSIDSLFNAMLNPFYIALIGALTGWAVTYRRNTTSPDVLWSAAGYPASVS